MFTNPQHKYLSSNSYAVTLKVTSSDGCVDQLTRETMVHVLPKSDFEATYVCVGNPTQFISKASIASGETLYHTWRLDNNAASHLNNPSYAYASSGSKQVWQWVQSSVGGCKDSIVKSLTVYPLPLAYAGVDTSVELGYSVELRAGGGFSYSWFSAPGMGSTDVNNPMVTPSTTTQYVVRVEDANGCVAYDSVIVHVKDTQRIVPGTIVTPDGNGENDTWVVRNIESYPDAWVRVLNSRGMVVLDQTNYGNDWDVRNRNGDALPGGTYYYLITFRDTGKTYKGAITVLR
jgi:gliding motility-associated-like protein